ncbi:hypothetical protein VTK56DRAFT_8137 [Thermocarpiscus australiensis]
MAFDDTAGTGEVHSALSLIENAGLPHPLDSLLSCFVNDAVDPLLAARYVHRGTAADSAQALVADWTCIIESITQKAAAPPLPDAAAQQSIFKRDANRCCVTGKAGRLWDPLVVAPILPVPSGWTTDKPRIFDMLGAFFGPPYRDWWLSYAQNPEFASPYSNHWLIRRSAHRAWSRGLVCLERLQPSGVEFQVEYPLVGPEGPLETEGSYPLLGDHSRSGIEKVDPRFIGTHARLARSIRFVEIAKSLERPSEPSSKPQPRRPAPKPETNRKTNSLSPLNLATSILLSTWLMFPSRLRVAVYDLLREVGALLYHQPDHATVHRLPFGLYLKRQTDPARSRNEFTALQLLRRHTTVPVPKPLDLAHKPANRADPFSVAETYLVTTSVPGVPLYRCQHVLSDADLADLAAQLAAHLAQLRAVPQQPTHQTKRDRDAAICDALGGAVRDPRIRGGEPVGPFPDEGAFSRELMFSDDPARRGHRVVFTHADLNPRNILVERRRTAGGGGPGGWVVSGIVDWETAGFYPEYWDCTKAFFEGFRWSRRYNDMMRRVFAALGDYEKELEIERRSWELGDGI